MDFSMVIAEVLGIFFALVGISMVANSKATAAAIEESVQNKGMLWMWGFLAVLIGAMIVSFNNRWSSGLPLLVTFLGWLALIKGAFILIFPRAAATLYGKCNKSGMLVGCGVIVFVLGMVLLYW
jgi:VIT1/CCC1 family predicted Fe2+/Mn2+ transporter